MPKRDETAKRQQYAKQLYDRGMKLVDIAKKLGVPEGTVRRWKSTCRWDAAETPDERREKKSERSQKNERSDKKANERSKNHVEKAIKQTLSDDELTPEQQIFCLLYVRTYNATQSYVEAFHSYNRNTAGVEGHKLLRNPKIKETIQRMKKAKAEQLLADHEDIVELQMRIAFADIGQYLEFEDSEVRLKDSAVLDTQLIQEVSQGKYGIVLKLASKDRAIEWLTKYFEMFPQDKRRAEYDRHRAEMEDRRLEMELLKLEMSVRDNDVAEEKAESDNFMEAFNTTAQEVWGNKEEQERD